MALISSSASSAHPSQMFSAFNKKVITLPRIEHPSKLINEDDRSSLDIRGHSRDGHGNGQLIRSESTTPQFKQRRRRSSSFEYNSFKENPSQQQQYLTEIPEYVNTIYGQDRDQPRLPIFGRRATSRTSSHGDQNCKTPNETSRLIIDELETILREKVRSQMQDVRMKFRHAADFDSNGKISREALHHIIASIFGTQKQISPSQIDKLLERLNLKNLNKISFDDLINSLFNGEEELPSWVSRQPSSPEEFLSKRTASQMFIILKDKLRTKNRDLINLCPSIDGGSPTTIFKTQFYNTLVDMGYRMKDKEFDKLWDKFDTDGFHAISSEKFLKRLNSEESVSKSASVPTSETQDQQYAILRSSHMKSNENDSPIKTPRLQTGKNQLDENQIRKWLNHKFPHGYSELEQSLEQIDTKQTGLISRDQFLEQLKRFGLTLEGNLFDLFLKRLNIDLTSTNGSISYKQVIQAFKQQTNSVNKRPSTHNSLSPVEYRQNPLERQVEYVISQNYERFRDELKRLDNQNSGKINKNDMKKLIEQFLEFPLRPDEYYQLYKQFPIDDYGAIKYNEYLKQVIEHYQNFQELIEQEYQRQTPTIIPQWEYMRSKNIRESLDQEHIRNKKREKSIDFSNNDQQKPRPIEQLREIVKRIIRDRYKDVEDEFKRLDRGSYGELTQDILYDLFKRLEIKPEITRSEIVLLWSRCHLKENGNLEFYQFLREFGYTKSSAHYPNAKQNPPRKGDADFLLTSRKLYADTVLVHGAALNAIRSNWDQLRQEFTQLDPYRTGFIQSDEFDEILCELCPPVNQEDLDILRTKFQTEHDSRMNYVRFLKHHAPIPQLVDDIDQYSRKRFSSATNDQSSRISSHQSHQNDLHYKLKRKLSDSYKQLRRSFKQYDMTNCGSVSVKVFREILNKHNCPLNDEEFYTLASQLDTKMDGTINYNYFIQQYIKNI